MDVQHKLQKKAEQRRCQINSPFAEYNFLRAQKSLC